MSEEVNLVSSLKKNKKAKFGVIVGMTIFLTLIVLFLVGMMTISEIPAQ